jgi:hypothetical protein
VPRLGARCTGALGDSLRRPIANACHRTSARVAVGSARCFVPSMLHGSVEKALPCSPSALRADSGEEGVWCRDHSMRRGADSSTFAPR